MFSWHQPLLCCLNHLPFKYKRSFLHFYTVTNSALLFFIDVFLQQDDLHWFQVHDSGCHLKLSLKPIMVKINFNYISWAFCIFVSWITHRFVYVCRRVPVYSHGSRWFLGKDNTQGWGKVHLWELGGVQKGFPALTAEEHQLSLSWPGSHISPGCQWWHVILQGRQKKHPEVHQQTICGSVSSRRSDTAAP